VAEEIATPAWTGTAATPEPTPVVAWMIHVVGAVVQPGVVTVPPGSRVIDAITAAGGLAPDADPGMLNLAAQLVDGCQIVIGWTNAPAGEVRQGLGGESPAGAGGAAASTINLNQATEAELDTLPGVGPVTATAILAWREKNGPFTAVAQLQEVDGIGPKTFAQIEPYVSV
jgi:competence protein ComEA